MLRIKLGWMLTNPAVGLNFVQCAGQLYLTQLLIKNDYMAGLKITQNRLEIKNHLTRGNNNTKTY